MKIHANTLTSAEVYAAARLAGVTLETCARAGSRSRDHAFIVYLSGTSTLRLGNSGTYGARSDTYAATWDEWGVFLGALFDADESLTIPHVYESREHYHWTTGDRFRSFLAPGARHKQHRWEYEGSAVTGAYHVHTCACGAVRRFMASGRSFAELVSS